MDTKNQQSGDVTSIAGNLAQEMADGPYVGDKVFDVFAKRLLKKYSDAGKTLFWCQDEGGINRPREVLKKMCREAQIQFSDYVPMSMRPKK